MTTRRLQRRIREQFRPFRCLRALFNSATQGAALRRNALCRQRNFASPSTRGDKRTDRRGPPAVRYGGQTDNPAAAMREQELTTTLTRVAHV